MVGHRPSTQDQTREPAAKSRTPGAGRIDLLRSIICSSQHGDDAKAVWPSRFSRPPFELLHSSLSSPRTPLKPVSSLYNKVGTTGVLAPSELLCTSILNTWLSKLHVGSSVFAGTVGKLV